MSTRMLIDARHTEETRVTVVKGNRLEEFDYESANKVQLKGNIYLAKITRVEPSLQAAFVDYGGNRHGFLAFSEIHPDYYQIPVEDREALLAEEARLMANEDYNGKDENLAEDASSEEDNDKKPAQSCDPEATEDIENTDDGDDGDDKQSTESDSVELSDKKDDEDTDIADELDEEEIRDNVRRRQLRALKRRYKIQEVIKPRQILLIQVVKEERGSKGAALTSYLSLPGRYTVLMPNTTHGGGISRKIGNVKDRKRLKDILSGIDITDGMGCIIRTAGMKRTKAEIKRDIDYLNKIWSNIRDLTMRSNAPALIYAEANLIKRSIRDLYDRSIDEIHVEGDKGFELAQSFMKLLMPSHAKKVIHYKDRIPLFHRYQIEEQLAAIFKPTVTLKSGGYLVINPTEALIAIDVNSGRATKGRHIEETALKTNIEASVEVARQLRLRDMSGLVVIDFIDMEDRSNVRKVERKLKDALKPDRARIQTGRISHLGLMELSRQRLRPNLVENSTLPCPHCEATGRIRTTDSAALQVIRSIEEEGIRGRSSKLEVKTNSDAAFYILNNKRQELAELESKYGCQIEILPDPSKTAAQFEIERFGTAPEKGAAAEMVTPDLVIDLEPQAVEGETHETLDDDEKPHKRKRRRGRRGGRRRRGQRLSENGETRETVDGKSNEAKPQASRDQSDETNDEKPKRQSRRPASKKAEKKTADNADALAQEEPKRRRRMPATRKTESADQSSAKKTTKAAPAKKEKAEEKPADGQPKTTKKKAVRRKTASKTASKKTSSTANAEPKIATGKAKAGTGSTAGNSKEEGAVKKAAKPATDKPKSDTPKKKGWWQRSAS
jgi:ribonuclease E